MSIPVVLPVASKPVSSHWSEGARLLEQAVRAGNTDPQTLYLLAMSLKRLGRIAEARQVLQKIAEPDANVHLQRGVLAFIDKDIAAAAGEFQKSWQAHPSSYPAAYNLMLAWLCQGNKSACVDLLPQIATLTDDPVQQRFLSVLRGLLGDKADARPDLQAILGSLTTEEEQHLLGFLVGLGHFEVAYPLLAQLVAIRSHSQPVFFAYFRAALVQGKRLLDRCKWEEAYGLLAALARRLDSHTLPIDGCYLLLLNNLLGICSCMMQDYERGAYYFRAVSEQFQKEMQPPGAWQRWINSQGLFQGAWIEQNLALAYEWQGRQDKADPHWNRYFDYLEHYAKHSQPSDYLTILAFEGLNRLADHYSKKAKWSLALSNLQRAQRLRPHDNETLEKLFQLFTQLKRFDEARRLLRNLRETRPNDPQVELFELEVRDVRNVEDLDRLVVDVRRALQKYQNDPRGEERANNVVANLIPLLERFADQFTAQVNKVVDQMRRLPSYQINWPMVRDVMRDMEDKFLFLRRIAQRTLTLLTNEDLRRDVNSLLNHCDRKLDQCHSLGN